MYTKKKDTDLVDPPINPFKENTELMVNTAWLLASGRLWPCSTFSDKEEQTSKKILRNFITQVMDPYQGYLEICQRVLLTEKQVRSVSGYTIYKRPSRWLNSDSKRGFGISRHWFEELQAKREKDPLYGHALRAFCEAILDMAEEPGCKNYNYWMTWFSKQSALEEHLVFRTWCARFFRQYFYH
jgi:hypothetical protein